jgi:glutathione S-transferase
MITVHHLNNSRSQRVLWLLEELGVKYEIKHYQRDSVTMLAPKSLKAVHPLGKSPVITDGDIVVAETGAIIEHILDRYGQGRLRPAAGTPDARLFTFFLHYAEGSAMPPLLLSLVFSKLSQPPAPLFLRPLGKAIEKGVRAKFLDEQVSTHFDFCEAELAKRPWFAGPEFTAADIQMSFAIEAAKVRLGLETRPKLQAFLDRIHARPAYKKALEAGGPFEI